MKETKKVNSEIVNWNQELSHDEWLDQLMRIVSEPETRDSISNVPEELLWKLFDAASELHEPSWLAFVLQDVGRCALIKNDWHKALWLKRLGELYLADLCNFAGHCFMREVHNHKEFQSLVHEFSASIDIDCDDTSAMIEAVDQLIESGDLRNPFFQPALLYLPLMRFGSFELERKGGTRLSAPVIALIESKCFARVGLIKDAKKSFDWCEPRLNELLKNTSDEKIGLEAFWVGDLFRKANESVYCKKAFQLCHSILPENHGLHKEMWGIRASAAKSIGDEELEVGNSRLAMKCYEEARSLLKKGISNGGDDCKALLEMIELNIGMARTLITGEFKHVPESLSAAESSSFGFPSGVPAYAKYAKLIEMGKEPSTDETMAMANSCFEIAKNLYEAGEKKAAVLEMLVTGFSALADSKQLPDGVATVLKMISLAESCKSNSPETTVEQYARIMRVIGLERE